MSPFELLPSGHRYKFPQFRTNKFRYSFVTSAIIVLNKKLQ